MRKDPRYSHPAWRKLRAERLLLDNNTCRACGKNEKVQVVQTALAFHGNDKYDIQHNYKEPHLQNIDLLATVCRGTKCKATLLRWMREDLAKENLPTISGDNPEDNIGISG